MKEAASQAAAQTDMLACLRRHLAVLLAGGKRLAPTELAGETAKT